MTSTQRRRAAAGVTLLEMLVAIGIFAIIASLLYGTFSRTAAARRYAQERAAVFSVARSAVTWLERDMQAAFSAGAYPEGPPHFVSAGRVERETLEDEPALLDLTTATSLGTTPLEVASFVVEGRLEQSDQARVVYRLEEPAQDRAGFDAGGDTRIQAGFDLVRYDFRPARIEDLDEASRVVIASGITAVELRFFDGLNWSQSWDSRRGPTRGGVPRMIETRVTVAAPDRNVVTFVSGIATHVRATAG